MAPSPAPNAGHHAASARRDVAQGLGDWLGAFEAVALHGAHQSIVALADRPMPAPGAAGLDVAGLLQATRAELTAAVRAPLIPRAAPQRASRRAAAGLPVVPSPAQAGAAEPDCAAYQRRYAELQRQMEQQVERLRARVRQQLSRATPRLRQLAALDVVSAQLLDAREQRLLATVPGWLERRFEQLRTAHAQANEATPLETHAQPAGAAASPPWLATFEREWQAVALAELEQRLLPVQGMVEAMNNEATTCR